MNRLRTAASYVAIAAIAWVSLTAGPAMAADDETGFVDDNYNGFREVVGEGNDAYWSVTIRSDQAYIATWERDPKDGVWDSPEEALEAINAVRKCAGDVQLAYLKKFANHDQFAAAPSTKRDVAEDGSYTWGFAEGSDEAEELAACYADDPWATEHLTYVETDDPAVTEIQIPVSTLGPGVHKLFFIDVASLSEPRYDYPNGAWTGYTTGYEFTGEPDWITVAVPEPSSDEFPFTTVVESGALNGPSGLAKSAPPFLDEDIGAIVTAALPALGAALALTAVIGVPTALFRSRSRKPVVADNTGGPDE